MAKEVHPDDALEAEFRERQKRIKEVILRENGLDPEVEDGYYSKATSKHLHWCIRIYFRHVDHRSNLHLFEIVDECCCKIFEGHKILLDKTQPGKLVLYGSLNVRKRENTVILAFTRNFIKITEESENYNQLKELWDSSDFKVLATNRPLHKVAPLNDDESVSSSDDKEYRGEDIEILENVSKRKKWQRYLLKNILFKDNDLDNIAESDGRTLYWIQDPFGFSGKSVFTKWLCANNTDIIKFTFGSMQQLKGGIITAGPRKVYIIDIPRTKAADDSLDSLISVSEDLLCGHVVSIIYGKYKQLFFNPPIVIFFTNIPCPVKKMSADRWFWIKLRKDGDKFSIRKKPERFSE